MNTRIHRNYIRIPGAFPNSDSISEARDALVNQLSKQAHTLWPDYNGNPLITLEQPITYLDKDGACIIIAGEIQAR